MPKSKSKSKSYGSEDSGMFSNLFSSSFGNSNTRWFFLIVFFMLLGHIVTFIEYMTMSFEKKIQIKEKYMSGYKGSGRYFVVDSENNVYKLVDVWFLGEFDRGTDFARINKGETYIVKGYGKRIPIISRFPRIYDVSK